jgi:hypothetical protein
MKLKYIMFTLILLACLEIFILFELLLIKKDSQYEVIVTGTHNQKPCTFEIWEKDSLIITVENCDYGSE